MRCWREPCIQMQERDLEMKAGHGNADLYVSKVSARAGCAQRKRFCPPFRGLTFKKAFVCLARVKGASHCALETLY